MIIYVYMYVCTHWNRKQCYLTMCAHVYECSSPCLAMYKSYTKLCVQGQI